jgi:hypothetical protein
MSEDAAFRRSKAARLVREYPELRDAIAKGEIHLTGLLIIGPHLGGERHTEVLRRARFRSKRELLRLVAEIDPKPEVPALIEPIGRALSRVATHAAFVKALAGPVRELQQNRRPEDWVQLADHDESPPRETGVAPAELTEPQRPLRYRVQFTASQEFVDLLDEARDLIGHESPAPDLPDIQLRDRHAYALGGPTTSDNLELRCRAHNTLAAEEDFGRRHMDRMRGVGDYTAPEQGFVRNV